MPTLDVILTQTQTPLTPKQADFLAQANNQGGGEHEKSHAPARHPGRRGAAGRSPASRRSRCARSRRRRSRRREARVISSPRSDQRAPLPRGDARRPTDRRCRPAREKIERDLEMARLAAEIHLRSERYAKRPKRKFVSASTQEYA